MEISITGRATLPSLLHPALAKEVSPETEAADESAVAAGDMAPRFLAPAEDGDVGEAHDVLAEDVEGAKGEDGVLGEVVAVVEGVRHEGKDPEAEVRHGVDEEEAELTLDCLPSLYQGSRSGVVGVGSC